MHQTFYIDIDEEITSVVDRLRKSDANEIVIVIPKRALLIQSIVNLKLLKKEADNMGKQIVIVTQDKLGKLLVENTGILVQQKVEDVDGEEIITEEVETIQPEKVSDLLMTAGRGDKEASNRRLDEIGSSGYFDFRTQKTQITPKMDKKVLKEKPLEQKPKDIVNKELVLSDVITHKTAKGFTVATNNMDMVKKSEPKKIETMQSLSRPEKRRENFFDKTDLREPVDFNIQTAQQENEIFQEEKLRNFFQAKEDVRLTKQETDYSNVNISGKFWKYILIIGLVALIAMLAVGAYLWLPKVDVSITTKEKVQNLSMDIKGSSQLNEVDYEAKSVPIRLIGLEKEIFRDFPATGSDSKTSGSQKARGILTVYNEFSTASQTLVATTRFETADGKIFRAVKSITIPGMTKVGEEMKPGAIEVEVVADAAGDQYNIEPTSFSIPGFKDNADKYKKFYAKSFKNMIGGVNSESAVKVVTKTDIENAKNALAKEIKEQVTKQLKDSASGKEIILDEAINTDSIKYLVSKNENEIADNFNVVAKIQGSAIAFSESDIDKLTKKYIVTKTGETAEKIEKAKVAYEFGKPEVDFANGSLTFRTDAVANIKADINQDELKKAITGKKEEELKEVLAAYPEISKIEINYWPSFISGYMPMFASRINLALDNSL
jgi:hypothetical protein